MRKILFLDFDGVLHSDLDRHFAKLPALEKYLLGMPDLEIVISSTWRENHSLPALRELFHSQIKQRVIAITPSLDSGYASGGRQREITAFLDAFALDVNNCTWIALDDMAYFFDKNYPHLLLVDSDVGFSDREGQVLLEWYRCGKLPTDNDRRKPYNDPV